MSKVVKAEFVPRLPDKVWQSLTDEERRARREQVYQQRERAYAKERVRVGAALPVPEEPEDVWEYEPEPVPIQGIMSRNTDPVLTGVHDELHDKVKQRRLLRAKEKYTR